MKKLKIGLLTLLLSLTCISGGYTSFNTEEANNCTKISPNISSDCLSQKFKTLICCFMNMKIPFSGNICIPMNPSSDGRKRDNVNMVIEKVSIQGSYTCSATYVGLKYITILIYALVLIYF